MRCIDADALSDWMKDYGQKCIKGERKISLMYIWKHIQDAPTIEPKTGRWIEDTEQNHIEKCWYCSECGYKAWGQYEKTDFCGGCGAKMDGGEQE